MISQLKDSQILDRIAELQEIQKRNHPDSYEWVAASKQIHLLFKEMGRRASMVAA